MSKHILPTSSNLLGICFVIVNFVKIWKVGRIEQIIVDKNDWYFDVVVSHRKRTLVLFHALPEKTELYVKTADIIILSGLVSMTIIAASCMSEVL